MAKIRYAEPTGNAQLDSFLRRHVDELNAELSLISRSLEKSTTELTEKVNKTAEVPKVIREKVEQHSQQIGEIAADLKELQGNVAALATKLTLMETEFEALRGTVGTYHARIVNLEIAVEEIQSKEDTNE